MGRKNPCNPKNESSEAQLVYANIWCRSVLGPGYRVNVANLLIVNPSGELLLEDMEMKPIRAYNGRISDSKSRELLKCHARV
jgi:hypothetical protein